MRSQPSRVRWMRRGHNLEAATFPSIVPQVFNPPVARVRLRNFDVSGLPSQLDNLHQEPRFPFEHVAFDCPKEPIRVTKQNLRKSPTFVLSEIQRGPLPGQG